MHTLVKIFRISAQGFYHVPRTPDFGTVDSRVFVIELQVKRHNFRRWESFRGLVDLTCQRYGRYKPPKKPNFRLGSRGLRISTLARLTIVLKIKKNYLQFI